jgi:hypothetical protein
MESAAQPGLQAGLAGKLYVEIFDRHIAQIERLPDRQERDDQEPIGLSCGGEEEGAGH